MSLKPVFEEIRVTRDAKDSAEYYFSMVDLRFDRRIWMFRLSTVLERTEGTTPEHVAEYPKTDVDVVMREIYPYWAAQQEPTKSGS